MSCFCVLSIGNLSGIAERYIISTADERLQNRGTGAVRNRKVMSAPPSRPRPTFTEPIQYSSTDER